MPGVIRGGRPPVPTVLKLIKGNPGRRRINKREPKPPRVSAATPPSHMSAGAKKVWPVLAEIVDGMGVLTKADLLALEQVCEAYAMQLSARKTLKTFGSDYYELKTKNGEVFIRLHPAVNVVADCDRRIRGWLNEFGMTPSARTRLKTEVEGSEEDPAAKYLTG